MILLSLNALIIFLNSTKDVKELKFMLLRVILYTQLQRTQFCQQGMGCFDNCVLCLSGV